MQTQKCTIKLELICVIQYKDIFHPCINREALTVAQKFPDCKNSEYTCSTNETLPLTNAQGMTIMTLAQDILLVTIHYQGFLGQFEPSM